MALSREDFIRAQTGKSIEIPDIAFGPPEDRGQHWPDNPDLRRAVEWFKSFMKSEDWIKRRNAAFIRHTALAFGLPPKDKKGRFFDESDTFGWYLFLADAYIDHIWNYEPMFGSRIIPVFITIGRSLDLLCEVAGVEERVRRLIGPEKRQPNGGIFELLVAAAYRRAGAQVFFRPEERGVAKTYDMDVIFDGHEFAVECKRMETSEYGEREREIMRKIWKSAFSAIEPLERSIFGNVDFRVPLTKVPNRYLLDKVTSWIGSDMPSLLWNDELSEGVIGELDITKLQNHLKDNDVLAAGTFLHVLLTGRYIRHAQYLQAIRFKAGISPRHIGECDLAVLLRWQNTAEESINGKARHVFRHLAEASEQLPMDKDGIVHIGLEAVEGDIVESARFDRILNHVSKFDPRGKPLRYVYCHYFVPESPPDKSWTFDETVQWRKISSKKDPLFKPRFLVVPENE